MYSHRLSQGRICVLPQSVVSVKEAPQSMEGEALLITSMLHLKAHGLARKVLSILTRDYLWASVNFDHLESHDFIL